MNIDENRDFISVRTLKRNYICFYFLFYGCNVFSCFFHW